jgi:uncharacterized integral membrane protein
VTRFARLVVLVPVAVILIVLAVANRALVTLSLDPFRPDRPALSVTMPLFFAIFLALLLGALIGGIAAWLGQGKWRRAAREARQEAARLGRELDRERQARDPGRDGQERLPAQRRPAA